MFFIDFVDNMEKIGDHLTNIAQGVLAGLQWSLEPRVRSAIGEEEMPPGSDKLDRSDEPGTPAPPTQPVGESNRP